jgi:C4-dicarboxylate-specific signal transduction histidine kinase
MHEYVTFETGCSTSYLSLHTSYFSLPFFTTKPTGQGTGLGLSLSYDIVKAHGGELRVETKEGEGSEFVIQLPIV